MSKYLIYRIDHPDPELKGKNRRRLNILLSVLAMVLPALYILIYETFKINLLVLYSTFIVIFLPVAFILQRRLNRENEKIIPIGTVEFTKTGIIKRIDDLISEYSYDRIDKIEIRKHIPAIKIAEGKDGYFTHILTISFKDSRIEKMVVSDRPGGKFTDLSIIDTIRTLGKILPLKIHIN